VAMPVNPIYKDKDPIKTIYGNRLSWRCQIIYLFISQWCGHPWDGFC